MKECKLQKFMLSKGTCSTLVIKLRCTASFRAVIFKILSDEWGEIFGQVNDKKFVKGIRGIH